MKKFSTAFVLALTLAGLGNIHIVRAQEAANEDKFSFGKVVSIQGQKIAVKEYDFAKDADVEVAYDVTTETELGNINAVTDLAVNDDVVIDYVEKEGKRVVTTLVKEDKAAEVPVTSEAAAVPVVPGSGAAVNAAGVLK
ncbi:MAG: hypothetical protein WCI27_00240 [Candidatus Omnitrophota bacterium]